MNIEKEKEIRNLKQELDLVSGEQNENFFQYKNFVKDIDLYNKYKNRECNSNRASISGINMLNIQSKVRKNLK